MYVCAHVCPLVVGKGRGGAKGAHGCAMGMWVGLLENLSGDEVRKMALL